mmetsp:Transcript_18677/g.53257  ORF Transcript_18677/g.53257 Transcript_18677/m.53257 type:complete len:255 (-) Transcript_18677:382-1146(-)
MPHDGAAERFYGKTTLPAVHDTRNDGALLGPGFHGQLDHLHRRLGGVGRGRGDVHARLRLHIGRHAAVGPSGGLRVGLGDPGPLVHRRAAPWRVTIKTRRRPARLPRGSSYRVVRHISGRGRAAREPAPCEETSQTYVGPAADVPITREGLVPATRRGRRVVLLFGCLGPSDNISSVRGARVRIEYGAGGLLTKSLRAVHHGGRIRDCEVRRASIGRAPDGAFGSAGVRGAMLHRGGRDVTRTALRLGGAFISF